MSKRRKYQPSSQRSVDAIYGLFEEYGRNPAFMRDFGQFMRTHESNLAQHPMPERMDESEPLISNAKALADRWGLRARWAPPKIIWEANINYSPNIEDPHEGLNADKFCFPLNAKVIICRLPPEKDRQIILPSPIEYDLSSPTSALVREEVMKEFDRQASIIEKRFEALGLVPVAKRSALKTHVKWLYRAICPDPTRQRPLNFTEIADWHVEDGSISAPPEPDTIRLAVRSLAKELDLKLPQKPGRPST